MAIFCVTVRPAPAANRTGIAGALAATASDFHPCTAWVSANATGWEAWLRSFVCTVIDFRSRLGATCSFHGIGDIPLPVQRQGCPLRGPERRGENGQSDCHPAYFFHCCSISSRFLPFVSGVNFHTNQTVQAHMNA